MFFGFNTGVFDVVDFHLQAHGRAGLLDFLGQVQNAEQFRELVEHSEFTGVGRRFDRQFHAAHRIANVQETAGLAALAIHRQRVAHGGLDTEAVERCAEHAVIVQPVDQQFVHAGLVGQHAVNHPLVEVGGPQTPNPTGKVDVVGVVDFREVIETAGLLGIGQGIFATVVLDRDVALFDVDVGRAIFAHGAQLDQVTVGELLTNDVEQVEGSDNVVGLGQHGMFAIDH